MNTQTEAGNAVRAVMDVQLAAYRDWDAAQFIAFTKLMSTYREAIFKGIAIAAGHGRREYYPATIAGFAMRCDAIFHLGLGSYKHDMMNFWLYAHDLKHLLNAEPGGVIRW